MHKVHTSAGHSHRETCADDTAICLCSGTIVRSNDLETCTVFLNEERLGVETCGFTSVLYLNVHINYSVVFIISC